MLIPAELFNRMERSLGNQLLITLVRNDLPQFAIYRIIALFMDNKNAIKINNFIVSRW